MLHSHFRRCATLTSEIKHFGNPVFGRYASQPEMSQVVCPDGGTP